MPRVLSAPKVRPHISLGQRPRSMAARFGRAESPRHLRPRMPQSLSMVIVHLVFSTKDRLPLISSTVREGLHAYMSTVARNLDCECLRVGGTEDHVHVVVNLGRSVSIAQLVEALKTTSSKWMKGQSPLFKGFGWQRGYGIFSVGPQDRPALFEYVDNQPEHHRTRTFQDEVRAFFNKYGVEYDERYLWD